MLKLVPGLAVGTILLVFAIYLLAIRGRVFDLSHAVATAPGMSGVQWWVCAEILP